ncbi:hypothetical protein TNCV_2214721 [Trichonephila clavipes]|nr:hypothetical protein TNCV_2214721 [Trichonephila clavipes]
MCKIKERIKDPLYINCKAKGYMASSTQCLPFPKSKKGKGKSPMDNLIRNCNATSVTPGILYSQVLNSKPNHQMSAPVIASSASDKTQNSKNELFNKETLNASHTDSSEFGFFLEMQKIFTLFPSLLIEMKKIIKLYKPS